MPGEPAAETVESEASIPPETSDKLQFHLDKSILVKAEKEYGFSGRKRIAEWVDFIRSDTSVTDMEKLKKVNVFFNKLPFVDDLTHWGVEDYWATPVEFLASNGGDCEDYALAKYFTLIAMGVNKRRLSLTYMEKMDVDEPHMVMTYNEVPGEEPLILDNLSDEIKLASQRSDLLPVYSVNTTGLWMANTSSQRLLVGTDEELARWKDLLLRMPPEFL